MSDKTTPAQLDVLRLIASGRDAWDGADRPAAKAGRTRAVDALRLRGFIGRNYGSGSCTHLYHLTELGRDAVRKAKGDAP